MKINVVDTIESFQNIEKCWDLLAEKMQESDFYVSFQWFEAFLNGTQNPPHKIHIIKIDDSNGVVAIFPMFINVRKMHLFKLVTLEFMGNVFSPFRSIICDQNKLEEATRCFVDYLYADKSIAWDMMVLDDVSKNDPFIKVLSNILMQQNMKMNFTKIESNMHVDLSKFKEPDDYFSTLKTKFYRNIRNRCSKMARDGEFRILLACNDNESIDKIMDDYYEIYKHSWKENERDTEFHRNLSQYMVKNNKLRLFQIYYKPHKLLDVASDKKTKISLHDIEVNPNENDMSIYDGYIPIASQYFIYHNGTAYCPKTSYDPKYSQYGAGTILFWVACKYMMEHDSIHRIDFQKGEDAYKYNWGEFNEFRYRCVIANKNSLRARLDKFANYTVLPKLKVIKSIFKKYYIKH